MSRSVLRSLVLVPAVILLLIGTGNAQVPSFDALYVFGDSLVDNGNDLIGTAALGADPPVPPSESPHRTYFNGRFSNGYVVAEYLWQALTGHGLESDQALQPFLAAPLRPLGMAVNFAFGGTGTPHLDQTPGGFFAPGLKGQIELYRSAVPPLKKPRRPLFLIVTGANDYRVDQYNVPLSVEQVVGNIVNAVEALHREGARDVMVLNLPDLGQVPSDPGNTQATLLSMAHNAALKAALDDLDARRPKLRIVQPDLMEAFNLLPPNMNKTIPALEAVFAGNPSVPPGFPISACLFIDPLTCLDSPVPFNIELGFLFWDVVHPTTEAHEFLAGYLMTALERHYGH